MAELIEYEATLNGLPHTLLLSPDDAEKYGDLVKKKVRLPQNKAVSASTK